MFDDGALAISLPAAELVDVRLPGSVFKAADLAGAPLSAPLRRAIDLVGAAASLAGATTLFVARPEIFAHGESLAWLTAQLAGASHHLSLSDGATVKVIPGFRNHVFFYGLGRRRDSESLARLLRRAPELFLGFDLQLNTALQFGGYSPASIVIEGVAAPPSPVAFYPIACDPRSLDDSLARTLRASPLARLPTGFDELTFAPLTEAGLADPGFTCWLAETLTGRYFDRRRALVLGLPETVDGSAAVEDRLRAALDALLTGGARTPTAPAPSAWFAAGDPDDLWLAASALDFVAPDTFEFWRAPPAAFRNFRSLTVFRSGSFKLNSDLDAVVTALTGKSPQFISAEVIA